MQGPKGLDGKTIIGPTGPAGLIGPKGNIGPKGIMGILGPTGFAPTGPIGPQGEKGFKGNQGPAGPEGLIGTKGLIGPAGEKGLIGASGKKGMEGHKGPIGPKGLNAGAPGSINLYNSFQGLKIVPHSQDIHSYYLAFDNNIDKMYTNALKISDDLTTITLINPGIYAIFCNLGYLAPVNANKKLNLNILKLIVNDVPFSGGTFYGSYSNPNQSKANSAIGSMKIILPADASTNLKFLNSNSCMNQHNNVRFQLLIQQLM
uniref:Collagen-like protein n=1 Tax=Pasteuria ramosa TaxID=225322 RepID=E7D275_9BACL|nr:collagen-like protein [Pasteuria ramosa]